MQTHDYVLVALVAFIIGAAITLLPSPTVTADLVQPYKFDFTGLSRSAGYLPQEEFPSH